MSNANQSDLRLFDLEKVGPELWCPNFYGAKMTTKVYLQQAHNWAVEVALENEFRRYVCQLLECDFRRVVDLGGHSSGTSEEHA